MTTDQKIIKNRLGLLELARATWQCFASLRRSSGILGTAFTATRNFTRRSGEAALADISKKKPIVKNRVEPHVEEAVVEMAIGRTDCRRRARFFAIENFRKRIKPHAIARRGSRLNSPLTAKFG